MFCFFRRWLSAFFLTLPSFGPFRLTVTERSRTVGTDRVVPAATILACNEKTFEMTVGKLSGQVCVTFFSYSLSRPEARHRMFGGTNDRTMVHPFFLHELPVLKSG